MYNLECIDVSAISRTSASSIICFSPWLLLPFLSPLPDFNYYIFYVEYQDILGNFLHGGIDSNLLVEPLKSFKRSKKSPSCSKALGKISSQCSWLIVRRHVSLEAKPYSFVQGGDHNAARMIYIKSYSNIGRPCEWLVFYQKPVS